VPQLSECFRELVCFTDALLDKELVSLCEESRADERMAKYSMLDLIKLKVRAVARGGGKRRREGSMMTYKTVMCLTIMRVAGSATSAMRKPQTSKRVRNDEA
jgi:hypothetical protein